MAKQKGYGNGHGGEAEFGGRFRASGARPARPRFYQPLPDKAKHSSIGSGSQRASSLVLEKSQMLRGQCCATRKLVEVMVFVAYLYFLPGRCTKDIGLQRARQYAPFL